MSTWEHIKYHITHFFSTCYLKWCANIEVEE